jgi:hypothetical protein
LLFVRQRGQTRQDDDDDDDNNDDDEMAVAPVGGSGGTISPIEPLPSLSFSTMYFHMKGFSILQND